MLCIVMLCIVMLCISGAARRQGKHGAREFFCVCGNSAHRYFVNKPPRYNKVTKTYILDFGKRVTMASVKNFQLVSPNNLEKVLLQFGRAGKDKFTMDFCWPLSPLQAFGISLSSFEA